MAQSLRSPGRSIGVPLPASELEFPSGQRARHSALRSLDELASNFFYDSASVRSSYAIKPPSSRNFLPSATD